MQCWLVGPDGDGGGDVVKVPVGLEFDGWDVADLAVVSSTV